MIHYVIPARGGSKTIPDKNLQPLGGAPLIAWTIAAARQAAPDATVVVNSDNQKILDVAESYGASAYKRPDFLGQDETSMKDVLAEYCRAVPEATTLVVLFPTCPFRTARSIRRAVDLAESGGCPSLMSVRADRSRPFRGLQIIDGQFAFGEPATAFFRKQETPDLYYATGGIWVIRREELPHLNTQLFNGRTRPFVLGAIEALDIDHEEDLDMARALVDSQRVPVPAFPHWAGVRE